MQTRLCSLPALVALAAVLVGCGSGGASQEAASNDDPVTLKVGAIPIVNIAPLFLGEKKGFFREENLKIKAQFASGGAAIVPAVVSGANDIGYGNITSTILARSKGLPLRIVANSETSGADTDKDGNVVLTKADGPIKSASDLNGKRVAINTLQNINEMTVRAAADKLGADSSTIRFAEIEFPDMLAALDAGRVDAAAMAEPFRTQAIEKGGYRVLFHNMPETKPKLLIDAYFVSDQYYEQNKDVVERFQRAIRKSNEYAQAHTDEVRDVLTSYTKLSDDQARKVLLPEWSGESVDIESIEVMQRLMVEYGLMDSPPKLDELVQK